MIASPARMAEVLVACLHEAGGDIAAGFEAAEYILSAEQPTTKLLPSPAPPPPPIAPPTPQSIALAHDIHNRRAQGILNRSLQIIRGLNATARRRLSVALKDRTGRKLLDFVEEYKQQLARLLTAAQMAALLEGAREVAQKVPVVASFPGAVAPPPTLEPGEAVALVDELLEMPVEERARAVYDLPPEQQVYVQQAVAAKEAGLPPVPPFAPPAPPPGSLEEVHFPVIDEAVKNLSERNLVDRQKYDAMESAARAKAFTVANVEAEETLAKIRDSLAENVREGADYEAWRQEVLADVDQGTFLSDAHQEVVFRTNVQSALSDGQEAVLRHPLIRSGFPYRQRDAIHDDRVRENHLALEKLGIQGTNIYRADDPVWQMFRVPWDYNDRCADTPVTVRQAAEAGIEEAREWLRTGQEPTERAFVPMPEFRPPEGFQRTLTSLPLSVQLSLQSMATFSVAAKKAEEVTETSELFGQPGIGSVPGTLLETAKSPGDKNRRMRVKQAKTAKGRRVRRSVLKRLRKKKKKAPVLLSIAQRTSSADDREERLQLVAEILVLLFGARAQEVAEELATGIHHRAGAAMATGAPPQVQRRYGKRPGPGWTQRGTSALGTPIWIWGPSPHSSAPPPPPAPHGGPVPPPPAPVPSGGPVPPPPPAAAPPLQLGGNVMFNGRMYQISHIYSPAHTPLANGYLVELVDALGRKVNTRSDLLQPVPHVGATPPSTVSPPPPPAPAPSSTPSPSPTPAAPRRGGQAAAVASVAAHAAAMAKLGAGQQLTPADKASLAKKLTNMRVGLLRSLHAALGGSGALANQKAAVAAVRGILTGGAPVPVATPAPAATPAPVAARSAPTHPAQIASLKSTIPFKDETDWETGRAQPATLNGIDFAPAPHKFWEHTRDADINEPKPLKRIDRVGILVQEPDGRVWIVQPTNGYGDRKYTMPGGRVEPGLTDQQNALKEVWEETGLQVEITGYIGDFEDSNNSNNGRLYIGKRVGGQPWDAKVESHIISKKTGQPAAESEKVTLVTPERAAQLLHRTDDLGQLMAVHPMKLDQPVKGKGSNPLKKLLEAIKPTADQWERDNPIPHGTYTGSTKVGDSNLYAVQKLRGFNKKPKVVSKSDFDSLIAQGGHIEMLRGLQDFGNKTAEQLANQFRTGEHHPGYGVFGNGSYADSNKSGNVANSQYGHGGAVVRMALPKTAKILKYTDLEKIVNDKPKDYDDGKHSSERGWHGTHAALAGYDAIHVNGPSNNHGRYGIGFYVILNRGILTVQKEDAKGHVIR